MLNRAGLALLALVLWLHSHIALAGGDSRPSAPSDPCGQFERDWTEDEKNAWSDLCRKGYNNGHEDESKPRKELREEFVSDLLRKHPYVDALSDGGLFLSGYSVKRLNLADRNLPTIMLIDSIIGQVYLPRATINGSLKIINSDIEFLYLHQTHVKGDLRIENGGNEYNGTNISNPDRKVVCTDTVIGGDLTISSGNYYNINLSGSSADGLFSAEYLDFTGKSFQDDMFDTGERRSLILRDVHTKKSLHLTEIKANKIDMDHASIEDAATLELTDAPRTIATRVSVGKDFTFENNIHVEKELGPNERPTWWLLDLGQSTIGRSIIIRNVETFQGIDISYSNIGSHLLMIDDGINVLDLSVSKISGALILGESKAYRSPDGPANQPIYLPMWRKDGFLNLEATSVGDIIAPLDLSAWPQRIDFRGFSLQRFLSDDIQDSAMFALRSVDFFPAWLDRGVQFSPQTFKETAEMLKRVGGEDAATAVSYASKSKQLELACTEPAILDCVGLFVSKLTIGYGYKLSRAFAWSLLVIALGTLVFYRSPEGKDKNLAFAVVYSFDHFIPAIKLREDNFKLELKSPHRYYFFVHKILGWVLVSFIIAGLSGLTK